MFSFLKKNKIKKEQRGFTLTELLVVMGIIFFLATISLSNYNKFGRTIDLENTAYAVALAVREAQVFGINRLSDSLSNSGAEDLDTSVQVGDPTPYGIYFNISAGSPVSGTGRQGFINFVDIQNELITEDRLFNDDGLTGNCSANSSSECLSTASFSGNTYIFDLCAGADAANCTSVDTLHITFKRPDPDAEIRVSSSGGSDISYARITLGSTSDPEIFKSVAIGVAGQITIE